MRNSALLLTAIESGDFSDETISGALDALLEDYGHTFAKRVKIVAHWIQTAEDAAIISMATGQQRRRGYVTRYVRELAVAFLRMDPKANPRIVMVPGNETPRTLLPRNVRGHLVEDLNTVQVGIGWVLECIEQNRGVPDYPGG